MLVLRIPILYVLLIVRLPNHQDDESLFWSVDPSVVDTWPRHVKRDQKHLKDITILFMEAISFTLGGDSVQGVI